MGDVPVYNETAGLGAVTVAAARRSAGAAAGGAVAARGRPSAGAYRRHFGPHLPQDGDQFAAEDALKYVQEPDHDTLAEFYKHFRDGLPPSEQRKFLSNLEMNHPEVWAEYSKANRAKWPRGKPTPLPDAIDRGRHEHDRDLDDAEYMKWYLKQAAPIDPIDDPIDSIDPIDPGPAKPTNFPLFGDLREEPADDDDGLPMGDVPCENVDSGPCTLSEGTVLYEKNDKDMYTTERARTGRRGGVVSAMYKPAGTAVIKLQDNAGYYIPDVATGPYASHM